MLQHLEICQVGFITYFFWITHKCFNIWRLPDRLYNFLFLNNGYAHYCISTFRDRLYNFLFLDNWYVIQHLEICQVGFIAFYFCLTVICVSTSGDMSSEASTKENSASRGPPQALDTYLKPTVIIHPKKFIFILSN